MGNKWIRLFEHQPLHVGDPVQGGYFEERHWQRLLSFLRHSRYPFFQVLPRGVRFSSYVGALQVEDLTIEIVPKTDRNNPEDTAPWQKVLVDLLHYCQLWRGEWIRGANLQVQPGVLLNGYTAFFLKEVERILRKGLIKTYDRETAGDNRLRGRLLLHRQITETRPVIWTDRQVYNFNHPYNLWLKAALSLMVERAAPEALCRKARALDQRFPPLGETPSLPPLGGPVYDRDYRQALLIAELLLQHYQPRFRSGAWPLMAVLFDMNALFEAYIARQLLQHCPPGGQVQRQVSTPFWNRRSIRPDLVVEWRGQRTVIDTKWKILPTGKPDLEDVKQIYVYNQYFDARQGILLYPYTEGSQDSPILPFAGTVGEARSSACRIIYAPVLRPDGGLNRELGKELWERI